MMLIQLIFAVMICWCWPVTTDINSTDNETRHTFNLIDSSRRRLSHGPETSIGINKPPKGSIYGAIVGIKWGGKRGSGTIINCALVDGTDNEYIIDVLTASHVMQGNWKGTTDVTLLNINGDIGPTKSIKRWKPTSKYSKTNDYYLMRFSVDKIYPYIPILTAKDAAKPMKNMQMMELNMERNKDGSPTVYSGFNKWNNIVPETDDVIIGDGKMNRKDLYYIWPYFTKSGLSGSGVLADIVVSQKPLVIQKKVVGNHIGMQYTVVDGKQNYYSLLNRLTDSKVEKINKFTQSGGVTSVAQMMHVPSDKKLEDQNTLQKQIESLQKMIDADNFLFGLYQKGVKRYEKEIETLQEAEEIDTQKMSHANKMLQHKKAVMERVTKDLKQNKLHMAKLKIELTRKYLKPHRMKEIAKMTTVMNKRIKSKSDALARKELDDYLYYDYGEYSDEYDDIEALMESRYEDGYDKGYRMALRLMRKTNE
eukprot:152421_1